MPITGKIFSVGQHKEREIDVDGCTYINRDVSSIRFRYTLALLPPLRCGNAKSNVFRENRGEKSFSAK